MIVATKSVIDYNVGEISISKTHYMNKTFWDAVFVRDDWSFISCRSLISEEEAYVGLIELMRREGLEVK